MRRALTLALALVVSVAAFAADPFAQSKPTLAPADYDQFESVSAAAPRGGLSEPTVAQYPDDRLAGIG